VLLDLASFPGVAPDTFQAVHFSADAYSRATYAEVKGADRRDQVYKNIERFLAMRALRGLRQPVAHVAFVVQAGNEHEAVPFVEHWQGVFEQVGSEPLLTAEWPPMDRDAIYLRRWNTADQPRADALLSAACTAVGLAPQPRAAGSF
jgi:hypothetical protein